MRDEEKLRGRYAAAGINLSIPVFNGHLFSARYNEADLRAQAAEQRLRDLENRVSRDVSVAWLNATTAYQRVDLTRQLLDQANETAISADERDKRRQEGGATAPDRVTKRKPLRNPCCPRKTDQKAQNHQGRHGQAVLRGDLGVEIVRVLAAHVWDLLVVEQRHGKRPGADTQPGVIPYHRPGPPKDGEPPLDGRIYEAISAACPEDRQEGAPAVAGDA